MSIYHDIIRFPSVTEKNTALRSQDNKYVFSVAVHACKSDIKMAVEKLFGVKVVAVNTLNVKGKYKKMGRTAGYRANWKKAIVRIEKGQSIDKFGEV